MTVDNGPEKQPIKMGDMVHDDHTTLLEVTFEPKCTDFDAEHFLWMCVCVCVYIATVVKLYFEIHHCFHQHTIEKLDIRRAMIRYTCVVRKKWKVNFSKECIVVC